MTSNAAMIRGMEIYTDQSPLPKAVVRIELAPGQIRDCDDAARINVVLEALVQRDRVAALAISLVCGATTASGGMVRARLLARDRLLGVEPVVDEPTIEGIIRLARQVMAARLL